MNVDGFYNKLLHEILNNGYETSCRTEGISRKTIAFPERFEYDMSDGFSPIIRVKPVSFKNVLTELLWFLKGNSNILYLLEHDNHIWTSDCFRYQMDIAYKRNDQEFLSLFPQKRIEAAKDYFRKTGRFTKANEILKEFASLVKHKPYYGQTGNTYPVYWYQFAESLSFDTLVPENTRLVMSSWQDSSLSNSALPPCHYSMQIIVNPDNSFDLLWNQRSVDVVLGLPYNILSYAIFMHLVAKRFRLKPNRLIGNLGHTHVYSNHYAAVEEIFGRYSDARLSDNSFIEVNSVKDLWEYDHEDVTLSGYEHLGKLKNATAMVGGIV